MLINVERSGTFMAGLAIAIAIVIATTIGGWFFVKGKRGDQTITVTGSARRTIKSELETALELSVPRAWVYYKLRPQVRMKCQTQE